MDKDLLIQQLREANNRNIEKRRCLAKTLRDHKNLIPKSHHLHIDAVLLICGPE